MLLPFYVTNCQYLSLSVFLKNRLRFVPSHRSVKISEVVLPSNFGSRLKPFSVNVLYVRNLLQKPFLIRHAAVLLFTLRVWLTLHLLLFRHLDNDCRKSPVLPFLQMFAHVVKGFNNLPLTTCSHLLFRRATCSSLSNSQVAGERIFSAFSFAPS